MPAKEYSVEQIGRENVRASHGQAVKQAVGLIKC